MKKCGVLLPVFALPSKYGIGTFGKWAYKFIDLLKQTGQSFWQILPLVQTGFCDSPYSTVCDISGNPYFIDPEVLRDEKLLTYREVEKMIDKSEQIDYGNLFNTRFAFLRKAFSRFNLQDVAFKNFLKRGEYNDYALFMALKSAFKVAWYEWDDCYKFRNEEALSAFAKDNKTEILFWQFLQFQFEKQYRELKKYANSKGIKIIGDLPFYVALDSVDVWKNPTEFYLDGNCKPTLVAGVPPDYFSAEGQLWGNPIYNFEKMQQNGFKFWKNRVSHARELYDVIRLDHFRAFDRFWAVDATETSAKNGVWMEGPKMELLNAIGLDGLFAEDLGMIDDGVRNLLAESNLSGTAVALFAFDSDKDNLYLPWNVKPNSVMYTGTHDNNTIVGLVKSLDKDSLAKQKLMIKKSLDYLGLNKSINGIFKICDAVVDIVYASEAEIAIIPMQDLLGLDDTYRTNVPGTTGNWTCRLKESMLFTDNVKLILQRKSCRFGRK